MFMSDPGRPASIELVDRILNTEAQSFDEIADNQEAGAVISVVTVHTDKGTWKRLVFTLLHFVVNLPLKTINQGNEVPGLVRSWGNL